MWSTFAVLHNHGASGFIEVNMEHRWHHWRNIDTTVSKSCWWDHGHLQSSNFFWVGGAGRNQRDRSDYFARAMTWGIYPLVPSKIFTEFQTKAERKFYKMSSPSLRRQRQSAHSATATAPTRSRSSSSARRPAQSSSPAAPRTSGGTRASCRTASRRPTPRWTW